MVMLTEQERYPRRLRSEHGMGCILASRGEFSVHIRCDGRIFAQAINRMMLYDNGDSGDIYRAGGKQRQGEEIKGSERIAPRTGSGWIGRQQ
jgi:hypothetical protein